MLPITSYLEVAGRSRTASDLAAATPDRHAASGRPRVVVWNLTRRCNQRCVHCYADATARAADDELGTDACLRILGELAEAGIAAVVFSGGEPLLRRDLCALVRATRELGMAPLLSSNGTLADHDALSELADAGLAYIGVSLDGPPSLNDEIRGQRRGWVRAVRGLTLAREVGLRTGLRMTVTARNADRVPIMFALAERVGAARFYVSHLVQSGRGVQVEALPPQRTRALLEALFALAREALSAGSSTQIVTGGNGSAGPLLLRWIAEHKDPSAAQAVRDLLTARGGNTSGVSLLAIDERGRVHPDQFWRGALLGDLRTGRLAPVLAHPLRERLARPEQWLWGRCGGCRHLAICGGGSRARAVAAFGDPAAPDPACVLTDEEVN